jgi:acetate---CoA ligase (ADP-forming)
VIAIFVEHIAGGAEDAAAALASASPGVPVLAVFMTPDPVPGVLREAKVPAFTAPEAAARALGRAAAYSRWRATAPAEPEMPGGVDSDAAAAIVSGALASGGGWLDPADAEALLRTYGIPFVEQRRTHDPVAAAAELGGPVAVKAVVPGVVHKARAGGVRLNVSDVDAAARELAARFEDLDGYVVQRMAQPGVEMLVGVLADERLGPVVACAAGGEAAQEIADVQVRLAPLAREEAAGMVRALRTSALLERAHVDIGALVDIIVRVAALADAYPAIAELDCNPVIVSPEGALAIDARVRVAPPAAARPFPALNA